MEQLRRVANIYFLIICAISLTPGKVTETKSLSKSLSRDWRSFDVRIRFCITSERGERSLRRLGSLRVLLTPQMRYRQDKRVNHQKVEILRTSGESVEWEEIFWKDLQVGDFLRIRDGEYLPADVILWSSSVPKGQAFVSTANLDGETSLKSRQALKDTMSLTSPEELSRLKGNDLVPFTKGIVRCGKPNSSLSDFDGSVYLEGWERPLPVGPDQLLIRSTKMQQTPWAIVLVVYTGHETKAQLNTSYVPSKRSRIERILNKMILTLLISEIVLSILSAVGSGFWDNAVGKHSWYLRLDEEETFLLILQNVFTFVVLYSALVPISLYVSVEITRLGQSLFIYWDAEMFDPETDSFAQCRNSNLNEELGQVKYIFSDKTGTLTANRMRLRQCSIAGNVFGEFPSSSSEVLSSISHFRHSNPKNLDNC